MVTHLSITIKPETEKKIREMSDRERISMNQICGEILEKNFGDVGFRLEGLSHNVK